MSACFGFRKSSRDREAEPLLPLYNDDTQLQRTVHEKLHSYQMIRAMSKGYMPSTDQVIVHLRSLLSSEILTPNNPELSQSGRLLIRNCRNWITEFIELLRNKNSGDQIQDIIWNLSKARISLDTDDLVNTATSMKTRADASAAVESVKTVGALLLTNSDFRRFLSDVNVIGRQVFADSAETASKAAHAAAEKIQPSEGDIEAVKVNGEDSGPPPSTEELEGTAAEVAQVVVDGAVRTGEEAASSLAEHVSGDEKQALLNRLKQVVINLRQRTDYSDSVSTISRLLQRYAKAYSRAVDETVGTLQEDVDTNPALDRALKNLWSLIQTFGDREAWQELEKRVKRVMSHTKHDPQFENLMTEVGNSLQKLLTDPDFFDSASQKFNELREKAKSVGSDSSVRDDVDACLGQLQTVFVSVIEDKDISKLIATSSRLFGILSPPNAATNPDLIDDSLHVLLPLLIQAIQYIPIPRLEIAVPEVDLLLENLIIEPGRTINQTSFLPFRVKFETYNGLEIYKARFRTATKVQSLVTIKLDGMSVRADEIGFWLRAHSGFLRLADEGIASFQVDERGIDVHIDVEVGKDRLEKVLSLKDVRVKIHKLSYTLRKSKFACLAWFFKPLLRPILRKVMERQIAAAIADALHAANRELLFARERLRATRISDPKDLTTFVKAIITRLTPEDDPDLYSRVGVASPGRGIFAGVYAPGSVVKLWEDEAQQAGQIVDENAEGGWRNEIFDVHTRMMT